jgi:hypothetical protein
MQIGPLKIFQNCTAAEISIELAQISGTTQRNQDHMAPHEHCSIARAN